MRFNLELHSKLTEVTEIFGLIFSFPASLKKASPEQVQMQTHAHMPVLISIFENPVKKADKPSKAKQFCFDSV